MYGVSDTEFAPDGDVTRAMFVTVLYRTEGEPYAENSSFVDVAVITQMQWHGRKKIKLSAV